MSYSNPNPANYSSPASTATASAASSPELKLYQAFIFSVPICFTFIILFLFYLVYLRRRSGDWSSLGMRNTFVTGNSLSTAELGLSKELREMLPIVVFKESFSITDSQCSVCLSDYQAEDKLQQIPACRHTFHMDCIDLWLTSHTTCPLCRLTLIPMSSPSQSHHSQDSVSSLSTIHSVDGGASSQAESQPPCEGLNHGNGSQEQQCYPNECNRDGNSVQETHKDDQNSIGTSSACCNCRLG